MAKSLEFWTIFILGLLYIGIQCDARAVNVSNTWTMPPEGLNVFYRFFRDRISWFEADAVCQFHHANLVTVDNSFQFDATRDLLRDLDVNDIVWIGLMRPQSSERFMWSNSRPLAADTGYWAESLPLMDAPLCAVIDPIRDYRWHALRCGGPETASFLCEMPVPSWADACIIKDMPALTMQYMADTASIDLIRNCGEEGLLRQSCRGKEDRERVIGDLICPKERYEAQRINDITSSHFKSLQIINSIPSDNNENNNIELLPMSNGAQIFPSSINDFNEQTQTEKNTVQRLIEQFNVDELMQADEPAPPSSKLSGYRIPGEIPKPVKKMAKKAMRVVMLENLQKKSKVTDQHQQQQQLKKKEVNRMTMPMDDMMMGDQPADGMHNGHDVPGHKYEDNETSNEIMQPLPHIKKVLPQDLRKKLSTISEREEEKEEGRKHKATPDVQRSSRSSSTTTSTTTSAAATSTTMSTTTTTEAFTTTTEATTRHVDSSSTAPVLTSTLLPISTATIGHPMHPQQQQRSSIINTEEVQHPHIKESADNSHFIPPMLMVKSHYVPPTKHEQREQQHQQQQHFDSEQHKEPLAAVETQPHAELAAVESTTKLDEEATKTTTTSTTATEITTADVTAATKTAAKEQHATELLLTESPAATEQTSDTEAVPKITTTTTITTITPVVVAATITIPKEDKLRQEQKEKKQLMIEMESNKTKHASTTMASTTMKSAETTKNSAVTIKVEPNKEQQQQQKHELKPELTTEGVIEEITTKGSTTTTIAASPSTSTTTPTAQVMLATARKTATTTTTAASSTAASSTEAAATTTEMEIKTETSAEDLQDKQEILTTDAPAALASTTTTPTIITTTAEVIATTVHVAQSSSSSAKRDTDTATTTTTSESPPSPTTTHNFLNEETEAPFKPNRRRSLTKPETASYFKKILG